MREDPGQAFAELDVTVSDNRVGEFLTQKVRLPIDREPGLTPLKGRYGNPAALTLLASPHEQAPRLATLQAGYEFEVDGQVDDYLRVRTPHGGVAFVRADQLAAKAGGKPLTKADFKVSYAISPPRVHVSSLETATTESTIRVRGEVEADDLARDLYITVYNPARDPFGSPQKVYYLANPQADGQRMSFDAEVPLQPGNNLIEVWARGRGDILGWSRHWVLATTGLAEARAAEVP
mgnify:CR=1 FL=1